MFTFDVVKKSMKKCIYKKLFLFNKKLTKDLKKAIP